MESKRKARTKHNHKHNIKTLRETVKFVMMFVNRMINYFSLNGPRFRIGLLEEDKCSISVHECPVTGKNFFLSDQ